MFTAGKAEFLKRLDALQKKLLALKLHCSRAVQATCFCLTLFSTFMLLGFALLGILYIKFFRLRCQQVNILKEVIGSFPAYSFPSYSSGLFEFTGGQLKVNTTLYAW